jgi:predicted DNA-binding transcriptional regulator AlpA
VTAASQLLTAEQVGTKWQIPTSQVYRLARADVLPCVRLGRYVRFSLDAIEAFERGDTTRVTS